MESLGCQESLNALESSIAIDNVFNCDKCGKHFKKKRYVRDHIKRVHEKSSTSILDTSHIKASLNNSTSSLNFGDNSLDTTVINDETFVDAAEQMLNETEIKASSTLKNEKNIKCSKCDKKFAKKSYVRLHERRMHKANNTSDLPSHVFVEGNEMLLSDQVTLGATFEVDGKETEKTTKIPFNDETILLESMVHETHEEIVSGPGPSRTVNPVANIYESYLYNSKQPMSRVNVYKKSDDFKCNICGIKFLTKRSFAQHFRGHGTIVNPNFLTNFVDKENESSLKNICLKRSFIALQVNDVKNRKNSQLHESTDENLLADSETLLINKNERNNGLEDKMTLSEICENLMDISGILS